MSIYGQCQWDGDTVNNFDFVRPTTAALYTFDEENCLDSSPNGNDLTKGSPTYDLGRFGQAVYFSGSKFKRATTYYPSLALTTYSIFCWIKTTDNAYQTIFAFLDSTGSDLSGYDIGTWGGNVYMSSNDGDAIGDPQFVGSIDISDGAWHWIALTRGATYTRIYVDGKLDLQDANQSLAFFGYEIACLGAWWFAPDGTALDKYIGYIDNLHILNTELSYATIRKNYAFQMGWI